MNHLCDDILTNRINIASFFLHFWGSLALLALAAIATYKFAGSKRSFFITLYAFLEYIFLVLCFTVICRKKGELFQFFPIPFYDYGHREYSAFLIELLMNVFMFVPFGFFLSLCFRSWSWQYVALTGIIFSTIIESLQWTFKCGSCETNDLINNTLGALIGYIISKKIYEKAKW